MRNLFVMFFSAAMIISCSAPTEKEDETPVSEPSQPEVDLAAEEQAIRKLTTDSNHIFFT